jgi:hypothetical protein
MPRGPRVDSSIDSSIWRTGLVAAAVAAAVNLALFVVGRATDVSFAVPAFQPDAGRMRISAIQVVVTSIAPLLVGTAIAAFAAARGRLRAAQIAGGLFALVSLGAPLSLEAATATKLSLAMMHVIVGTAFVLALQRVFDRDAARAKATSHRGPHRRDEESTRISWSL